MAKQVELTAVIKLRDEMSKQLKNVKHNLENLKKSFSSGKLSTKTFDSAIKQIESSLDQMTTKSKSGFEQLRETAKKAANGVKTAWIKAFAAIGGATYALMKGFDLAREAAKTQQILQAFAITAKRAGEDVKKIFDEVKKASGGLIDDTSLVKAINQAKSLGIPYKKMAELMEVARYRARLTGRDVTAAFNDIVTGVGRLSPLILDNLGITIKLGQAFEDYAKKIGKTVDQLTPYEQKMAVLDKVMKQSRGTIEAFKKVHETTFETFQKMNAEFENLKDSLSTNLIPLYSQLSKLLMKTLPLLLYIVSGWRMLVESIEAAIGALKLFNQWRKASTATRDIVLKQGLNAIVADWRAKIKAIQKETEDAIAFKINWDDFTKNLPNNLPAPNVEVDKITVSDEAWQTLKEIQAAIFDATAPDIDKQKRKWDTWAADLLAKAKAAGLATGLLEIRLKRVVEEKKAEIEDKYRQERLKKEVEFQSRLALSGLESLKALLEFKKSSGQIDVVLYLTDKIEILKEKISVIKYQLQHTFDPVQAQMLTQTLIQLNGELATTKNQLDEIQSSLSKSLITGFNQYIKEIKPLTIQLKELMYNTAEAMESSFSDLFFDSMRGKIKSLQDYFRSFSEAVQRYIADMLAKMMMMKVLNPILQSVGLPTAHTGGVVVPNGIQKFHSGGVVGLRSDEVPAILQVGEVVLTKNQAAALANRSTNVTINVSNETGLPVDFDVTSIQRNRENEIINVVLKHARTNPAFKALIGGK